jgi:hypothetical protein
MILLICDIYIVQIIEGENRIVVTKNVHYTQMLHLKL